MVVDLDRTPKKHVIGKVYAEWCGHCKSLEPEWKKLEKYFKHKKQFEVVNIKDPNMREKIEHINNKHKVKLEANGYPTIFSIKNGKLKYYNGNRNSADMIQWYLHGGEGDLNGGEGEGEGGSLSSIIAKNTIGGKRTRRQMNRRHARTRKYTPKKRPGFLQYLFGR